MNKKYSFKGWLLLLVLAVTCQFNVTAQLCGSYTINGALATGGTNYQTFSEATGALNTSGISCAVVFNVSAGTYTDSVYLGNITGSSATNTISFIGADAMTTTLTYDGSNTQPTWQMVGTNNVIIKHLTIETTKTAADAWGIHLSGGVNELFIDSCRFPTPTTTTSDIMGIVASASLTTEGTSGVNVDNLTVTNSYFTGGESGIHIEGANAYSTGFNFSNNEFHDHDDQALEVDNVQNIVIRNNSIEYTGSNTSSDGLYLFDVNDYVVDGNTISVSDWGIYVNDGNDGYTPTTRSVISNNMVISATDYGIYLLDSEVTNIYNNTAKGDPAFSMNDQVDVDIRNNIFYGDGNISFSSTDALTSTDIVDYNMYSSTVSPISVGGVVYTDLAAWQFASPAYNVNSIEALPVFVSATDLHMNNDLNVFNTGIDVGLVVDIDGDARPQVGGFDIGADEFQVVLQANDLGVMSLLEPTIPFCSGSSNIKVVLQNQGSNTIDSVNLTLALTGSTPTTFNLGNLNILSLENDTIDLGAFTFNIGTIYDITINSFDPNGVTDVNTSNDTLIVNSISPSLNGTFTINSATATGGTNFQSFSDAAAQLNSYGICGPVVFNVAAGTYTENVFLGGIAGSSSTNTISFIGAGATSTILTYDGSSTQSTLQLAGTNNLIIKHLTIETTKTSSDGWGIHMSVGVNGVLIDSCRIITPISTTTDLIGIVASNSLTFETSAGNNVDNLTVTNTYFEGGETGMHIQGATSFSMNFTVSNNQFNDHDDQALEMDNVQNVVVENNSVSYSGSNTTSDGIYLTDINEYKVNGNSVSVPDWGIYVNDGNDNYTPTSRSVISNNMVISADDGALELNDFESTNVYNNTATGNPAILINDQVGVDIRNNIFYGDGNISFLSTDALTATDTVDYNMYSSTVSPYSIGGNVYTDLLAWQTADAVNNVNSIEAVPVFISPTDLHLLNDVNAHDNGIDVGLISDIDGAVRPQDAGFDIGADEFNLIALTSDVGVTSLVSPSGAICEDTASYFTFVVANTGLLDVDTIPYSFSLVGASSVTFVDTSFTLIPVSGTNTITVGPINTMGMGASVLTLNTYLAGDVDGTNDTLVTNILFNTNALVVDLGNDTSYCENDAFTMTLDAGTGSTYSWSTTASTQTINVTTAGDYGVMVTDALGCVAYDTLSVVENAAPGVDLGNDTSYCENDLFTVTLDAGTGSTYSWSTTATTQTINVTTAGIYGVTVTDASGCVGTDSITVVENALPVVDLGNDTSYCENDPFVMILNAGSATSYSWSTMATSQLINVLTAGSYDVAITNALGCVGYDTITIVENTLPAVDLGSDASYCENDNFALTLDAGIATTYSWSTMATTQTISVTTAGTYDVTITDANGCSATDVLVVVENAAPIVDAGNDTTWCPGASTPLSTDNGAGANYVWMDSVSNVVTSIDFAGTYTVVGTDMNGCTSTDTLIVDFCPNLGLSDNNELTNISVYPNPANNVVYIDMDESISNVSVEFVSLSGQLVHSTYSSVNGTMEIDVTGLNEGIYFMKISADAKTFVQKFVKK